MRSTVLIVDDDPGFRAAVRGLLEAVGWAVVGEAADGLEALASARDLAPDLVLLDLRLPGRSGLDVATQLEAERFPGAVVLMSSQGPPRRAWDPSGPVRGFLAKEDLSTESLAELVR